MATATTQVIQLALDGDPERVLDAVDDRILDAALELVAASGMRHLTMDDVATKAGAGRMTVYRRFGSRNALLQALTVRECRDALLRVGTALDPQLSPSDRLARLFSAVMREIATHPLLGRLARVEPEVFLREITNEKSAVITMAREFLVQMIREGQRAGEIIKVDPVLLAEIWVRLGASFVLMPETVLPLDDERATRRAAKTILEPYVINPAG